LLPSIKKINVREGGHGSQSPQRNQKLSDNTTGVNAAEQDKQRGAINQDIQNVNQIERRPVELEDPMKEIDGEI